MYRPWSEEDEILLEITMGEKDLSYAKVAETINRTVPAVRNKAYKLRQQTGFKSNRWTKKEFKTLKILTAKGIGNKEIGEIMGRTTNSIINKKYKSKIRNRQNLKEYKQTIEKLGALGYTAPQIACELGLTRKSVSDFCRYHKIKLIAARKGEAWR